MIIKEKLHISQISWLSLSYDKKDSSGIINTFYEPESIEELKNLCQNLYAQKKDFLVIGHTSNLYFAPDCMVDIVVSTRRCTRYEMRDDSIYCECGVHVMKLSQQMCEEGVAGFDGLIDLPGTVASSIYGNSSAFGCSINSLLIKCEILLSDGTVKEFFPEDLKFTTRASALKNGEIKGVILSAVLRKTMGDEKTLCESARINRQMRKDALPGPAYNLGSIFRYSDKRTLVGNFVKYATKIYATVLKYMHYSQDDIQKKRLHFSIVLMGARELEPYIYGWNLYMWKDVAAHKFFPIFLKKHNKIFKNDSLEIEIIH